MPINIIKLALAPLVLLLVSPAQSATSFFNSPSFADNPSTYSAWLSAIGIGAPEYLEDFEDTGTYVAGADISGVGRRLNRWRQPVRQSGGDEWPVISRRL